MATYTLKPGSRSQSVLPGDILIFTPGIYDYFTADGMSGTKDNPIVFQFQPGVIFQNGFDFSNVNYLTLDGGDNRNLLIPNASGVPFSFKGKCNGIVIKGNEIQKCYSYIWFKTEVAEPAFANWNYYQKNADGTISPNFIMDGLTLINCKWSGAEFDGGYIGSTGQKADRAVKMIDGNIYYPYPAKVDNIIIQNVVIDGAARTGLQVSGLKSKLKVNNTSISNCGKSLEQYQGACFLIGGNSSGEIEIDSNTFDGSNLYAVRTDCGGILKFTNNTVRNATVVNGVANSQPMAAVQFDSYESDPLTLIVTGNDIDDSNNGVSIVVYGNNKSITPGSTFAANEIEGQFQNFTGATFQDKPTQEPPTDTPPVGLAIITGCDFANRNLTVKYSDGTTKQIGGVYRYQGKSPNSYTYWLSKNRKEALVIK